MIFTDSSRGNASQSRIDVDDSEGDTSFGQPGSSSYQGGNEEASVSQLVQGHSMDPHSFDTSEPNSLQMSSTHHHEQEQHNLSQNINFSHDAPTSFSRDMFPRHTSHQENESETVKTRSKIRF